MRKKAQTAAAELKRDMDRLSRYIALLRQENRPEEADRLSRMEGYMKELEECRRAGRAESRAALLLAVLAGAELAVALVLFLFR